MLKTIGVDIDGVVADFSSNMKALLEKQFGLNVFLANIKDYDTQIDHILDSYPIISYRNLPVVPYSLAAIQSLRKEGKKVLFITKRAQPKRKIDSIVRDKVQQMTKWWLQENGFEYDDLIFANDKTLPIRENKVDIMIEDNLKNALSISDVAPVILINRVYNQASDLPRNVYRLEDWQEISWFLGKVNEGKYTL